MPIENQRRRTVWISDELWEKMQVAAKLDGRTVSSWLRSRAELALAKEIRRVVTVPARPTGQQGASQ
jgi:hypothetical protein